MDQPYGLPGDGPLHRLERQQSRGFLPRGWIAGLVLSNDTTDATNDTAISAGVCRSTSNIGPDGLRSTLTRHQVDMEIPVSIVKQLDVAWAPENYDPEGYAGGDRSGGRSSSSISDTTWHVYVIAGNSLPDDVLLHDGADPSAVLPNGYTAWRRIGSVLRESAALVTFVQEGDVFARKTLKQDASANAPGTSAVSRTLSVPLGVNVFADILFNVTNVSTGNNTFGLVTDLAFTDEVPDGGLTQIPDAISLAGGVVHGVAPLRVRTNTSAQVRSRVSFSSANITVTIYTRGWLDTRGRDA